MKTICVYSGSNPGLRPEYKENARLLGKILVENKMELIYGGSKAGLMGEISNEVLKNNGKVTGIIPEGLFSGESAHGKLTKLIKVKDMHERKRIMAELSDGFIALPGGLGTYEELFEMLSWAQLGIHKKPIGLLNVLGYFDPLINMLQTTCTEGFMNESNLKIILTSDNPLSLIEKMKNYIPPIMKTKWHELSHK
ncbi:TIGR00730 family Rossman fold protein [Clostridium sp. WILCCON 0269]|uniref:Cytokinin riboside 5'-monophosphate phosphoribohydrolase n=1 Tax=Candidatus Clostridium eludens TaxID=3381663 RepID=A0ABW8SP75_9CLOT